MSNNDYQLILCYLDKRLDKKTVQQVEERLQNDQNFRNEMFLEKLLQQAAQK